MSVSALAAALKGMARGEAEESAVNAELGTVTSDLATGTDVTVRPDGTSIMLSFTLGSLVIADSLHLRINDRVFLIPIRGGQIYGVAFRLSTNPL